MVRIPLLLLSFSLMVSMSDAARAQSYGKAPRPGKMGDDTEFLLKVDQKLGAQVPLDITMFDHESRPVTFRDVIQGKPTILVPAYYRCPKLCNEVLNGLLASMRKMRDLDPEFTAGKAFNVVTFSIDAREAPALTNTKRAHYLMEYDGRSPDVPGWWFLTTSQGQGTNVQQAEASIHTVTDSIGYPFVLKYRGQEFQYIRNSETSAGQWLTKDGQPAKRERSSFGHTDDYFHPAAVVILTPEGKVSRYFMDVGFEPRSLRLALVEASGGKIGSKIDQIALLCSSFDETTGHYKPAMIVLAGVAAPFVFLVLGIAFYAWRKSRKEQTLALPQSSNSGSAADVAASLPPGN